MKIFKVKDNYNNMNLVTRVVDEDDPSCRVEILDMNPLSYKPNQKKVYGINWQACGTVTVEKAEEYVKLLQTAIQEAKKANK